MDDEPAESLWVGIRGQANVSSVVLSVCYKPTDQEETGDWRLGSWWATNGQGKEEPAASN